VEVVVVVVVGVSVVVRPRFCYCLVEKQEVWSSVPMRDPTNNIFKSNVAGRKEAQKMTTNLVR